MNLNKYTEGSNRMEDSTMEDLDVVSLPFHLQQNRMSLLFTWEFYQASATKYLTARSFEKQQQ
jgi:hypothetical protein